MSAGVERAGRLEIPVVIELGPGLERLAGPPSGRELTEAVATTVGPVLAEMGIAGTPAVAVARGRSLRAVRIRVRGVVLPYRPELMHRVWWSVAPADLLELPVRAADSAPGFPDAWLVLAQIEHATAIPRRRWRSLMGRRPRGRQLAIDYIARLAAEVVRQRPSALLSDDEADAVPRGLLDLGLSARTGPVLQGMQEAAEATGRSRRQLIEAAFTELRPERVEVHLDRPRLRQMGVQEPVWVYDERVDEELRSQFQQMEAGLLDGLGIRIPSILLVPSGDLPPNTIAVKLGDALEPPMPVLSDGFTVVGVKLELARLADRLIDLDEVDQLLARLGETFPMLVWAVVSTIPLEEVTRLLRGLLREGVSIRDLRGILELLIRFAPEATPMDGWDGCLAYVRSGMTDYLTRSYGGGLASRAVITVHPSWEERLAESRAAARPLDDDEQEAWRDAVWSALQPISDGPATASVVTDEAVRSAVRELLAPELPELPVLSRSEIADSVRVKPAATIGG